MKFTRYLYSVPHQKKTPLRLKYIIEKYAINKEMGATEFVNLINDAYYKFVAESYKTNYERTQCDLYADFLKNVPPGFNIVDVGAGTGASFRIIKKIKYKFNKYYFIEPSQHMAQQFCTCLLGNEQNLDIFVGSLDQVSIEDSTPKVFILSGVLRTIVDLDGFLADLKEKMGPQDFLFLPVEPNNEAFTRGSVSNILSAIHTIAFSTPKRYLTGIRNRLICVLTRVKRESDIGHLEKSLNYLFVNELVSSEFNTQHLYAIINYHNYLLWRSLEIPANASEGFFTFDEIQRALDVRLIKLQNLYFFQFHPSGFIGKIIESILNNIFPKSAATVSCLFRKG